MNIPNALSISRLFLLPLIMAGLFMEAQIGPLATWFCFVLYLIAALTDYLDGYLARKFNQISEFGVFFDPISDKIFVGALLVLLVGFGRLEGLWMVPVILILSRELLVSGLREYLGPYNVQMPVTPLAKWKTATQMAALGLIILGAVIPLALMAGQVLLLVATLLTLQTGWIYLKTGLEFMKKMP